MLITYSQPTNLMPMGVTHCQTNQYRCAPPPTFCYWFLGVAMAMCDVDRVDLLVVVSSLPVLFSFCCLLSLGTLCTPQQGVLTMYPANRCHRVCSTSSYSFHFLRWRPVHVACVVRAVPWRCCFSSARPDNNHWLSSPCLSLLAPYMEGAGGGS